MATMNISLPDELKQFIDAQVSEHGYGSTSEYLRDLIRKQRDVEKLRGMLPNILAVNFYRRGDVFGVANTLNGLDR